MSKGPLLVLAQRHKFTVFPTSNREPSLQSNCAHPVAAHPWGASSAKDAPVQVNCTESFEDEARDLQT